MIKYKIGEIESLQKFANAYAMVRLDCSNPTRFNLEFEEYTDSLAKLVAIGDLDVSFNPLKKRLHSLTNQGVKNLRHLIEFNTIQYNP